MDREQKYFLELIKAHLNNANAPSPENVDFSRLFEVCEVQNMTAMAAIELKKFVKIGAMTKEDFSPFNQVLGLTLQTFEYKERGKAQLEKFFYDNGVEYIYVKGAALRSLYPVPEVRTSGDIDVIIDLAQLTAVKNGLLDIGFELIHSTDIEADFRYSREEFEIKTRLDSVNDKTRDYFSEPFKLCENAKMTDLNHLLYVACHILKHFKSGGAGVRQLADMDVLIRNTDIDVNEFLTLCESLGLDKSSKVLLILCKTYFGTPINFDYEIEPALYVTLENVILNGGVFGYGIGNIGTTHLMRTMNDGDTSKASSYKAVLGLFRFDRDYLSHHYEYAKKHPSLLPAAYMSRLFGAVFKRGGRNVKHIKSMFTDREIASKMSEMLKELEIN